MRTAEPRALLLEVETGALVPVVNVTAVLAHPVTLPVRVKTSLGRGGRMEGKVRNKEEDRIIWHVGSCTAVRLHDRDI